MLAGLTVLMFPLTFAKEIQRTFCRNRAYDIRATLGLVRGYCQQYNFNLYHYIDQRSLARIFPGDAIFELHSC